MLYLGHTGLLRKSCLTGHERPCITHMYYIEGEVIYFPSSPFLTVIVGFLFFWSTFLYPMESLYDLICTI